MVVEKEPSSKLIETDLLCSVNTKCVGTPPGSAIPPDLPPSIILPSPCGRKEEGGGGVTGVDRRGAEKSGHKRRLLSSSLAVIADDYNRHQSRRVVCRTTADGPGRPKID